MARQSRIMAGVTLGLVLPVMLTVAAAETLAESEDYYWRLGAGVYGTPVDTNDADQMQSFARFDWQFICFGNHVRMPVINECLRLNPRQKYLVRLWPLRGNMLDYFYTPGCREETMAMTCEQIRLVLDNIDRPDHVVGYTFVEELPDRWHPFYRHKTDEQVAAILEPYRAAIEKELGRPMHVDESLRDWFWEKFVTSINEIHAAIRAEDGADRLVLFYPRYDWFHTDLLERIVKPGVGADGVFIYVLRRDQYRKHTTFAAERGWPFFSQLSHNTGMKQQAWESLVGVPETKSPYNLGYFFYGGGNPLRPHWFDNPAVDPVNNVRGLSRPVHLRWFLGNRNIGWDVFKRTMRFRPRLDLRMRGQTADLHAVVPNPILEGHYPTLDDQKVTDVTVSLSLPEGWAIEEGTPVVALGELDASRHRSPAPGSVGVAHWRLRVADKAALSAENAIRVAVEGSHRQLDRIRGEVIIADSIDHRIPCFKEQKLLVSGQGWAEPGFVCDREARPAIILRTAGKPVAKPSVADGNFSVAVNLGTYKNNAGFYRLVPDAPVDEGVHRIVYNETLPPNSTLTIYSTNNATLCLTRPLFERVICAQDDPGDGASAGYYMGANAVRRAIPEGEKVRIEISGKAKGDVNSHAIAYFTCDDTGERKGMGILCRRFGPDWREGISVELDPPFPRSTLQSVALYRFPHGATGTIWYGSLKVDLASRPKPPRDVGAMISGTMPVIRQNAYNILTYFDEDTTQPHGSKISVQLAVQ